MPRHAHPLARVAFLTLVCTVTAARAQTWPQLRMPADAQAETIASDMVLNGKPCRMFRFQVRANDDEVLSFYRQEFGAKHVENRVKSDRVIATRQGDYFVTVQVHALDKRTVEATVMTTLIAGKPVSSGALVDTKKLLPSDTQVVSTVQTGDAGKRSLMVVGVNRNSLRANRDAVVDAMRERGFKLTNQDDPPDDKSPQSMVLQLSTATEEASVTISDVGPYRSVVINRIHEAQ